MSINLRVKEVRDFLGLSQAKFAENLHLSSGYISSLEKGNRVVNPRIIKLICTAYGINETWLKSGRDSMYDLESNVRVEQASRLFQQMYPECQEHLLQLIRSILSIQNIIEDNNIAKNKPKK